MSFLALSLCFAVFGNIPHDHAIQPKMNVVEDSQSMSDVSEVFLSPTTRGLQNDVRERARERRADAESLALLEAATAAMAKFCEKARAKDRESLSTLKRFTESTKKQEQNVQTSPLVGKEPAERNQMLDCDGASKALSTQSSASPSIEPEPLAVESPVGAHLSEHRKLEKQSSPTVSSDNTPVRAKSNEHRDEVTSASSESRQHVLKLVHWLFGKLHESDIEAQSPLENDARQDVVTAKGVQLGLSDLPVRQEENQQSGDVGPETTIEDTEQKAEDARKLHQECEAERLDQEDEEWVVVSSPF